MAIDTLAYAKKLEAVGVERSAAEAHAEALAEMLTHNVLPDVATKVDLAQAVERLEHRIEQATSRLTIRIFGITFVIIGLTDGILFALLRAH
jgi:hypothetical protein